MIFTRWQYLYIFFTQSIIKSKEHARTLSKSIFSWLIMPVWQKVIDTVTCVFVRKTNATLQCQQPQSLLKPLDISWWKHFLVLSPSITYITMSWLSVYQYGLCACSSFIKLLVQTFYHARLLFPAKISFEPNIYVQVSCTWNFQKKFEEWNTYSYCIILGQWSFCFFRRREKENVELSFARSII